MPTDHGVSSTSVSRDPCRAPRGWLVVAGALCIVASPPARAQDASADRDRLHLASAAFDQACRKDAAGAWGTSLCGPVLLVDRSTRAVVANQRDAGGALVRRGELWEGRLPDSVMVANTAIDWSGTRWATIVLPLPADDFSALALIAHESFHRIQPSLGLTGTDAASPHLDERDARLWLRLELRALAHALTTGGEASRAHARTAMRFRAERRRLYPGSGAPEDALERLEGSAEYTGARFALDAGEMGMLRVVRAMDAVERNPTLVRSFAYATGPALGLLLDRWAPGWQRRVAAGAAMAPLLAESLGATVTAVPPAELARPYGYAAIAGAEDEREAVRREALAGYRKRLVDGALIVLPADGMSRSFDPNTLQPLDSLGTVYPTGRFTAPWGTLDVTKGGALLSVDYRTLRLPAPAERVPTGSTVRGDGWTLALAEGWEVRAIAGGRGGDVEVARRR